MKKKAFILTALLSTLCITATHAQKRAFTIPDAYRLKTAISPAVSIKGQLAYYVSASDLKTQKSSVAIYLDGQPLKDANGYAPQWSSDGNKLYYTASTENGPQVSFFSAYPVHEFSGEEIAEGVYQRKRAGDKPVLRVRPSELRGDEVFPRKRQNLPVEIVHRSCKEQQRTDHPPEVRHFLVSVHFELCPLLCFCRIIPFFSTACGVSSRR